jgi:hypothetical protein
VVVVFSAQVIFEEPVVFVLDGSDYEGDDAHDGEHDGDRLNI